MRKYQFTILLISFLILSCEKNNPTQVLIESANVEDNLSYNEAYKDSIIAQDNGLIKMFHKSGNGIHNILTETYVRSATWTPNKWRILYSTPYDLCLVDADGKNAHKISREREFFMYAIASPSGKKIAYLAIDTAEHTLSTGAIKIMNADGSGSIQITPFQQSIGGFTWTSDSKSIVYITNINGFGIIRQISIDGNSEVGLFDSQKGILFTPALSNDGKKLAFSAYTDSATFKIMLLNMQSGQIKQLTTGNSFDENPSWSADANALVYQRAESVSPYRWTGSSIWYIQADGLNNLRLTTPQNQCYDPDWR